MSENADYVTDENLKNHKLMTVTDHEKLMKIFKEYRVE